MAAPAVVEGTAFAEYLAGVLDAEGAAGENGNLLMEAAPDEAAVVAALQTGDGSDRPTPAAGERTTAPYPSAAQPSTRLCARMLPHVDAATIVRLQACECEARLRASGYSLGGVPLLPEPEPECQPPLPQAPDTCAGTASLASGAAVVVGALSAVATTSFDAAATTEPVARWATNICCLLAGAGGAALAAVALARHRATAADKQMRVLLRQYGQLYSVALESGARLEQCCRQAIRKIQEVKLIKSPLCAVSRWPCHLGRQPAFTPRHCAVCTAPRHHTNFYHWELNSAIVYWFCPWSFAWFLLLRGACMQVELLSRGYRIIPAAALPPISRLEQAGGGERSRRCESLRQATSATLRRALGLVEFHVASVGATSSESLPSSLKCNSVEQHRDPSSGSEGAREQNEAAGQAHEVRLGLPALKRLRATLHEQLSVLLAATLQRLHGLPALARVDDRLLPRSVR
eukprot:COSAG05_NODE_1608_length_4413_cov_6.524108_5_plen_460_part_00